LNLSASASTLLCENQVEARPDKSHRSYPSFAGGNYFVHSQTNLISSSSAKVRYAAIGEWICHLVVTKKKLQIASRTSPGVRNFCHKKTLHPPVIILIQGDERRKRLAT
jgi:hypothetical protein